MAEPFLGEMKIIPFGYPPKGWAYCDGQLLPINQNQALFALLGTSFGGNGQTTFALPDLRGRIAQHMGPQSTFGQSGGEYAHTLTAAEMPTHVHFAQGSSNAATTPLPAGQAFANPGLNAYAAPAPAQPVAAGTVSTIGGSQPHENSSPYLVLSFVVALQGIFPSQN